MKILEKKGKNDSFIIVAEDYVGSGWIDLFYKAIISKISPKNIERIEIESSWNFSEFEILFEKNNLKIKVEIDDLGPVAFVLKTDINENSKQSLRDWVTIVLNEVKT